MKTCFCIGHREAEGTIFPALLEEVTRHIELYHVTEFVVGRHGQFDSLAAAAVVRAKQRHPEVTLTLLLAYHPAEQRHPVPKEFDRTYYPSGMEAVPRRFAIVRANQLMVTQADCLLAYVWHTASNAQALVDFARRHAVPVTLIPRFPPSSP